MYCQCQQSFFQELIAASPKQRSPVSLQTVGGNRDQSGPQSRLIWGFPGLPPLYPQSPFCPYPTSRRIRTLLVVRTLRRIYPVIGSLDLFSAVVTQWCSPLVKHPLLMAYIQIILSLLGLQINITQYGIISYLLTLSIFRPKSHLESILTKIYLFASLVLPLPWSTGIPLGG